MPLALSLHALNSRRLISPQVGNFLPQWLSSWCYYFSMRLKLTNKGPTAALLALFLGACASATNPSAPTPPTATPSTLAIQDLAWLSGRWVGTGQNGDEGVPEGTGILVWGEVKEGTLSSTFQWHAPESQHVHYAFTVFEQTDDAITGGGIHYGRDFQTFETAAWRFEAVEVKQGLVKFRCVAHCRAKSVTYQSLPGGRLEARWDPVADDAPDWIMKYRRD